MRLPLKSADDIASIDIELMKKMVDSFIAKGFTYFDTAWVYHNEKSEGAFRQAVSERYPRTAYTITDKMPCWMLNSKDDLQKIFDTQLQRCGVDYFDYYLIHSLNKEYYNIIQKYEGFEFIAKMKEEGKIKHIGFSFHDEVPLLEQILEDHPESEFVQLQINYLDWENPTVCSRECYETAVRHGKPVIVMEPVKGGSLAKVPTEAERMFKDFHSDMSVASWALRYAASLDNVFMVLSGMHTLEQIEDNTSYMSDFKPVSDEEKSIISKAGEIINSSISIPCTACHYCTDGCPQHICIPEYFTLYNTLHMFGKKEQGIHAVVYYSSLSNTHGKASYCIECGQCEQHCPQHIAIIERLKDVANVLEH